MPMLLHGPRHQKPSGSRHESTALGTIGGFGCATEWSLAYIAAHLQKPKRQHFQVPRKLSTKLSPRIGIGTVWYAALPHLGTRRRLSRRRLVDFVSASETNDVKEGLENLIVGRVKQPCRARPEGLSNAPHGQGQARPSPPASSYGEQENKTTSDGGTSSHNKALLLVLMERE